MKNEIDHNTLIAFAAGELSEDEAGRVRAHISSNPDAQRRVELFRMVEQIAATDDSIAPPRDVVERAKALFAHGREPFLSTWLEVVDRMVATLLFDSRVESAMAGYRGSAELTRLTFECELGHVDLQIGPSDEEAGRLLVMGQIAVNEPLVNPIPFAFCEVGTTTVATSSATDATGSFSLTLVPGRYDLHMRVGDRTVIASNVTIE